MRSSPIHSDLSTHEISVWKAEEGKKLRNGGGGQNKEEEPTFDIDWRCVTACFHDAAKEDGDICYITLLEDRIILCKYLAAIPRISLPTSSLVVPRRRANPHQRSHDKVNCKPKDETLLTRKI
jgi:hypothetical protein